MDAEMGVRSLVISPEKNVVKFFEVMTTRCIQCGKPVMPEDGMFYGLLKPHYAVIHRQCAPYCQYPNQWPHSQTYHFYANLSNLANPQSRDIS